MRWQRRGLCATVVVLVAWTGDAQAFGHWFHFGKAAHSVLLERGAVAIATGRLEEGVALTLKGLTEAKDPREASAGYSNLCAAYALLKRWDDALPQCNHAIELDPGNWRSYNNRAAVFTARAEFDLAIADINRGLDLVPSSPTLLRSLQIVQENQHRYHELRKTAVPA